MSNVHPPKATSLDWQATEKIVAELRDGASLARWTIAALNVIGLTGVGGLAWGTGGAVAGFVVGAVIGSLFGGIVDASMRWMAQSLLYQRELLKATSELVDSYAD